MQEEVANKTSPDSRISEFEEGLEISNPLKRRKVNEAQEEVNNDKEFSWIGPLLWIGPASRGRKQSYKSFRLHGITYCSKDFAYVFSRPGIPYDVVQILQLWQNHKTGRYARVRRFCRMEQNFRCSGISSEQTGELFATEIFDDINLDCIQGKCTVQYVPIEKRKEYIPNPEKDKFFFSMYLNPVDGEVYTKKDINIQIITPLHLIFRRNEHKFTQTQLECRNNIGFRRNGTREDEVSEQEAPEKMEEVTKAPASRTVIRSENSAFSPPKHRQVNDASDSEQTQELESQMTPQGVTSPSRALETNESKPLDEELNDKQNIEEQAQDQPKPEQKESHAESIEENEQLNKHNKEVVQNESSPSDLYDPLKDEVLLGSDREIIVGEPEDLVFMRYSPKSPEYDKEEVISSRRVQNHSSDTEEPPKETTVKKVSPSSSIKSSPQGFLSDSDTSSPMKPIMQRYEDVVYSSRRKHNGASSKPKNAKKETTYQDTQYFSSKRRTKPNHGTQYTRKQGKHVI